MKSFSWLLTLCGLAWANALIDAATTSVSFDQDNYDVVDNEGALTVTVVRSGDTQMAFNVELSTVVLDPESLCCGPYDTVPATPSVDFLAQDVVLTFAPGDTSKEVTVPILAKGTVDHESRMFALQLKSSTAGISMHPAETLVTIRDNEVPANLDWSFLPAVVPGAADNDLLGYFRRITALKPDGTIVTMVDVLNDPSSPANTLLTTARIVFLSSDGDATGTADVRLQHDGHSLNPEGFERLVLQPDGGMLLIGGFDRVSGEPHNSLVRLKHDGSLDSSFEAGFGPVPVNASDFEVSVLALFRDGRIVVGVVDHATYSVSVLLLGPDGRFDPSFTPTRVAVETLCDSFWRTPMGVTTQDGRIFVYGPCGKGLLRLGLNGGIDETFGPQFVSARPDHYTNTVGGVGAVLSQANGRLVVGGDFASVNGTARSYIARLNPDGSLDPGFKAALLHPFDGSATILSDGSILVLSVNDFVEFDTNGEVKTRFPPLRNILFHPAGAFAGRFAIQSETPKRILVVNGGFGVNNIQLGLARVLLDEAPRSAFQITGEPETGGENYFGNDVFARDETESSFEFVVQRVGETSGPATVKFITSDGTAKAGVDYVAQAGTLNFAPLETKKLVEVPLTGLTNRESRVFFLSLSEATGATLAGQPPVPVTIMGKGLPPGKITPLQMPDGGVALILSNPFFGLNESRLLVEVSSDLNAWLPSTGYEFDSLSDVVVWIDRPPRGDSPRFYRVQAYQP